MQPLVKAVFGFFKSYNKTTADEWIKENKGKTMTICYSSISSHGSYQYIVRF